MFGISTILDLTLLSASFPLWVKDKNDFSQPDNSPFPLTSMGWLVNSEHSE